MKNKEIHQKIRTAAEQAGFDALLLTDLGNIQYASGFSLPFAAARRRQPAALLLPVGGEAVLFLPAGWSDSIDSSCRVRRLASYGGGQAAAALTALIGDSLQDLGASADTLKIGIDLESASQSLFSRLEKMQTVQWNSCDGLMRRLRADKTAEERELLAALAMKADHAVNGCLHHITVDRRMSELTLAEELRVHSLERDVDLQGYNAASQVCSGAETAEFWPNTPKFGYAKTKDLREGDTIRVQLQLTRDGCWGASARMMVNRSHLNEAQERTYSSLNQVHELLLTELTPGKTCREVFEKVLAGAEKKQLPLAEEFGLGRGIGVSPFEAPFISASDETVIEERMVLVLDPVISTEDGIYRSMNTVIIESDGARVVGWYKDWHEPYTPIMSI